jgi:acetolactate synthase-1/2/3 large subunit
MSQLQNIKRHKQSSNKQPEKTGQPMLGSEILVEALVRENVDTIFAYPGGASMEIHQVLSKRKEIRTILPRHEQGGVFAADGYARASGKVGVCMATSGPGATNLVTGIANAYADSIPIVAITGQVAYWMIGKNAFQETDIFGITQPIVKHSYLITDASEIARVIKEAFYIASSGRPGPVVIDIPKNVQQQRVIPHFPEKLELRGYQPDPMPNDNDLAKIIELIETSERPVLYVGGGIISGNAHKELIQFVEATKIPVTTTLMGIGAFPETHPLSLKWLGMHGSAYANWAVAEADLLLAFGVRFDDRVTGNVKKFCEHGKIVHIDIDESEINKNKVCHLPIVANIKHSLKRLNEMLKERPIKKSFKPWHEKIDAWKIKAPFKCPITENALKSPLIRNIVGNDLNEIMTAQIVIEAIYEATKGDAIVTTGVGQHQMWAAQFYKFNSPRHFISSCGLGSMGFGFPAAIGAKAACPDKQVIDIDGDGSFLMNIQELATAHIEKIPVKAVIFNNQYLGMVMQWEDRFYSGNRGHTFIGDPSDHCSVYPDFPTIAKGFGVKCEQVKRRSDLKPAIQRMLEANEPYVLDVLLPHTCHVTPFIKAGGTIEDMIYE